MADKITNKHILRWWWEEVELGLTPGKTNTSKCGARYEEFYTQTEAAKI